MNIFIDFALGKIEKVNPAPIYFGNNNVDKITLYFKNVTSGLEWYPTLSALCSDNNPIYPRLSDTNGTGTTTIDDVDYTYFEFTLSNSNGWNLTPGRILFYAWINYPANNGNKCVGSFGATIVATSGFYQVDNPYVSQELRDYLDLNFQEQYDLIADFIGGEPRYVDTSTNILAHTTNEGVAIATDNGHWYYWDGSQYVDSEYVYQAIADQSITWDKLASNVTSVINAKADRNNASQTIVANTLNATNVNATSISATDVELTTIYSNNSDDYYGLDFHEYESAGETYFTISYRGDYGLRFGEDGEEIQLYIDSGVLQSSISLHDTFKVITDATQRLEVGDDLTVENVDNVNIEANDLIDLKADDVRLTSNKAKLRLEEEGDSCAYLAYTDTINAVLHETKVYLDENRVHLENHREESNNVYYGTELIVENDQFVVQDISPNPILQPHTYQLEISGYGFYAKSNEIGFKNSLNTNFIYMNDEISEFSVNGNQFLVAVDESGAKSIGIVNYANEQLISMNSDKSIDIKGTSLKFNNKNIAVSDDINDLQSQIDGINAGQNLADIVADLTALSNLDTSKLKANDKVQVLVDSNHSNASTVYNWTGSVWSYIGKYGQDSYTISETNSLLATKQNVIDSFNMLNADLVDDSIATNKFVTAEEKAQITANATAISGIKDGTNIDSFGDVESELSTINTTLSGKQDTLSGSTSIDITSNVVSVKQSYIDGQFLSNAERQEIIDEISEVFN